MRAFLLFKSKVLARTLAKCENCSATIGPWRIVVRAFCITAFFVIVLYHIFYRLSTVFGKRVVEFSLRLGHARVLTSHRDVIHFAHAASLRRPLQKLVCVQGGRPMVAPTEYDVGYCHACRGAPWCSRLFFGSSWAPTPTTPLILHFAFCILHLILPYRV